VKARQFEEDISTKRIPFQTIQLTVGTVSTFPDHSSSRLSTATTHYAHHEPPPTHPPYTTPNYTPPHNTRHAPHTKRKNTPSLAADLNRTTIGRVLGLRLCPGRLGIHRCAVGTLLLLCAWLWRGGRCLLALTFLRRGGIRRNDVGATSGSNVECTIDMLRDGGNLRPKLLLDTVEVKTIFVRHQVDGETQMSEPTGTTNTVEIRFGVLGEIEVDDNIDRLNIDTTSKEVRAHEVSAHAVTEVVEDAVAVRLQHFRVRVEARIAKVGDLLCEQFDPVCRITEDDRLVDLQLTPTRQPIVDDHQ